MLNYIVIIGRLTRDPELRHTRSGISVASFTVAVDRDFGTKGAEKETDFIDCVAWRSTGDFVSKYFSKGSMIVVAGRLQIRGWTDNDGNKRRTAEVVADSVYFGGSKRDTSQSVNTNTSYEGSTLYGTPPPENGFSNYAQPSTINPADFSIIDEDDPQLPF